MNEIVLILNFLSFALPGAFLLHTVLTNF